MDAKKTDPAYYKVGPLKVLPQDLSQLNPRERKALLAQYLGQNRARPARRFGRRASSSANRIIRPLSKQFKASRISDIGQRCPEIAGDSYAKLSRPHRISRDAYGAILHITARGPAATLLSASSDNLLSKVNQFCGLTSDNPSRFTRLRITQGELSAQRVAGQDNRRANAASSTQQGRRGLTPSEAKHLQLALEPIENNRLKRALEKLGRGVYARKVP